MQQQIVYIDVYPQIRKSMYEMKIDTCNTVAAGHVMCEATAAGLIKRHQEWLDTNPKMMPQFDDSMKAFVKLTSVMSKKPFTEPMLNAEDRLYEVAKVVCTGTSYKHWDNTLKACVDNKCVCANGEPLKKCPVNGQTACKTCSSSHQLWGHKEFVIGTDQVEVAYCIFKECECKRGDRTRGSSCPSHRQTDCSSCKFGYKIQSGNCVRIWKGWW